MKILESLFKKEVTRKEFLTISTVGVVSLLGFGSIIKLLTGKSPEHHLSQTEQGYNSGAYGGVRADSNRPV